MSVSDETLFYYISEDELDKRLDKETDEIQWEKMDLFSPSMLQIGYQWMATSLQIMYQYYRNCSAIHW